jgi:Icc protein
MNRLYLAHLTDTHLNAPGKPSFMKLDVSDNLEAIIEQLEQLQFKLDGLLISGDLVHEGDAADYEYFRQLTDKWSKQLSVPVMVALGNHDHIDAFKLGYLGITSSESQYYYSQTIGEYRVITLDSRVEGEAWGLIDQPQLDWLKDQLVHPANNGTIIMLHHPPQQLPTDLLANHLLRNPDELANTIKDTDVIGLLAGHIHFNSITTFAGVPVVAGTGTAFGLDLSASDSLRFYSSVGYNLISVRERQFSAHPIMLPKEHRLVYEHQLKQPQKELQGSNS